MKKRFVMVFVGTAALLASGCSYLAGRSFTAPEVRFKDLRVQGVGLTGGTLDIVLGVVNPNGFGIDAKRLTYRLMVDSTVLGEGVYDKAFTLSANDSATIHFPLTLDYNGLASAGRQLMGKGSVEYRIVGDVTVGTPKGDFSRPYSQLGRFTTFGGVSR